MNTRHVHDLQVIIDWLVDIDAARDDNNGLGILQKDAIDLATKRGITASAASQILATLAFQGMLTLTRQGKTKILRGARYDPDAPRTTLKGRKRC